MYIGIGKGYMSKLLINEPPLQVLPSLAKAIGLNEAIVLQQLHYWLQQSSHCHDGRRWIYNTYEGWQKQFPFWSLNTIRRALGSLRDKGLVITTDKYNKRGFDNTLWYAIDYEVLVSAQNEQTMCSEWADDLPNLSRPIPETTTETTTERKSSSSVDQPSRQKNDDDKVIFDAWAQNIPGMMTPILAEKLHALIDECGVPSVLAGITTGVEAGARNLKYITACARNHAAGVDKSKSTYKPKLTEQERGKLLTRAKAGQSSLRTAEKFGFEIDPAWQRDITLAREAGVI